MEYDLYPIKTSQLKPMFGQENDFNNWLSQNLDELSDIFTVNFEFIKREASVDKLRLDILAEFNSVADDDGDATNHIAAIEVQYGSSNSKHFGQLITYGAQHNARYCIWIAESFKPGHLQAIEVLNNTSVDIDRTYFAVTAQLLSISPNKEKGLKLSIATIDAEQPLTSKRDMSNKGEMYWEFFEKIRTSLLSQSWYDKNKSTPRSYFEFSSKIKSSHHSLIYGWNFLTGGIYRIYLAIYRKTGMVDHSEGSIKLLDQIHEILKNNSSKLNVGVNSIVKDDKRPKSYITVGVHYPSDTDISIQKNFNDMVTWSSQIMIKFYELLQPQLENISKTLDQ